jgi:NMD protein affecting ribosome stability and mRNA decay
MGKCESCGKEVESLIKIKGQKLCTECAVKTQKDIDSDSLNFSACILFKI